VVHDPAITARGAKLRHMVRVEVHFADGTLASETVEAPRGSEQKFASEADVVDKFRKLARRTSSDTEAERMCELVLGCEKLDDVSVLVGTLAKRA
jgi:2-methylcitrate dehydratase PrpD